MVVDGIVGELDAGDSPARQPLLMRDGEQSLKPLDVLDHVRVAEAGAGLELCLDSHDALLGLGLGVAV